MKADTIGKMMKEHEFRKGMYLLFSRIYGREPDLQLLKDLADAVAFTTVNNGHSILGFEELQAFLESFSFDQNCLDHLGAEFAELFLGIGKSPVHPYESVYTEKDGLVMGEATKKVRRAYRQQGYVMSSFFKEPDDHLSVEFEFMALLCDKMNQCLIKKLFRDAAINWSVQKDFFNQHLANWIPDFCIAIIKNTKRFSFFAAFAKITKEFINFEKDTLANLFQI